MSDFRQNERDEDCFIIEGLPLIPSEIVGKEWQELAVSHVKGVITPLMGRDLPIVVVQNVTGRHKGAPVKYSVKMATIADSDAIRKKFGAFFFNGGGKDSLPTEYKGISIRNRVTPETKIRITILQLLAKRYKDSNPGSKVPPDPSSRSFLLLPPPIAESRSTILLKPSSLFPPTSPRPRLKQSIGLSTRSSRAS